MSTDSRTALGSIPKSALLTLLGVLALIACTSPEEQRAEDQSRCSGYGFQPGTTAFAQCMMTADMRRDAKAQADKDRAVYVQGLSRSRDGNASYPVCSAMMSDAHLDVSTGKWAGPNCRQE